MLKTIRIPVMLLTLALLVLLPKASYADWHDRDHGDRAGHRHDFHSHANPDLTLVSGMEGLDSRVLIAADPDETTEVIDQPAPQITVINAAPHIGSDMDTFLVNVPNNKGGYTPVLIRKWGNAYLGPQGELYYPFPEISQLKVMYGI